MGVNWGFHMPLYPLAHPIAWPMISIIFAKTCAVEPPELHSESVLGLHSAHSAWGSAQHVSSARAAQGKQRAAQQRFRRKDNSKNNRSNEDAALRETLRGNT